MMVEGIHETSLAVTPEMQEFLDGGDRFVWWLLVHLNVGAIGVSTERPWAFHR